MFDWQVDIDIPKYWYGQEPQPTPVDTVYNYIMLLNYDRDQLDIDACIEYAALLIFKNYPIWDELLRTQLNKTILSYFLNRGIAYETPGLWKFHLNNTMNIIMPKYNDIAHSNELFTDENILGLKNIDTFTEEYTEGVEQAGDSNSNTDSTNTRDYTSDYTSKRLDELTNTLNSDLTLSLSGTSKLQLDNKERFWDTPQLDLSQLELSYATTLKGVVDNTDVNTTNELTDNTNTTGNSNSSLDTTDKTIDNQQDVGNTKQQSEYTDSKLTSHKLDNTRQTYGNSGHSTQLLIKEYRELIVLMFDLILHDEMLNKQFLFLLSF